MNPPVATFLWRKIDHPGHDCCQLCKRASGWWLSGTAVFWDAVPCQLRYEVVTDRRWRTRHASVEGYIGKKIVALTLDSNGAGEWRLNGVRRKNVAGCLDADLGFTPATNLMALRRLALKVGQRAEAPAAYVQFPQMTLIPLPQTYQRLSRRDYAYASPSVGYTGTLQVSPIGAVTFYPGLFAAVTSG
jgi:uncharacterized protein